MEGVRRYYDRVAQLYSDSRPRYPAELFEYLANCCHRRDAAWDCATGNGQAALSLIDHFEIVFATDQSAEQLRRIPSRGNLKCYESPAEANPELHDGSIDLVTIAQALHWFKRKRFYREVRRVVRRNGVIAAWCYQLPRVNSTIDRIVFDLYNADELRAIWPSERRWVDGEYQQIPFPFEEVDSPTFSIAEDRTSESFIKYLRTWPAVGMAPAGSEAECVIEKHFGRLRKAWASEQLSVNWNLALRVGRIE